MLALLLTLAFGLISSGLILKITTDVQDKPYMDEIFHVPQAQQYCAYNFSSWDPMITTLPGLYLSAVSLLWLPASLTGMTLLEMCTTFNLRVVNLVFFMGNFILLFLLSSKLNKNTKESNSGRTVLHAAVLVLFPVLHFFSWLFYTDPGSTFFTLLMYLCCLRGQHWCASLAGTAAILFRQTNVIWVVFCTGLTKARVLEEQLRLDKRVRGDINNMKDIEVLKLIVKTTFSGLSRFLSIVTAILKRIVPYLCVIFGFGVFVFVNKGIVVGDRSHHEASYNFPQVFYFLLVSSAFSFIHLSRPKHVKSFFIFAAKNPLKVLAFSAVTWYLVRYFTYEHVYLLSDNRHYTFYFWARIFKRHELARYVMIPAYLYCFYQFYCLTQHRGLLWRVCYSVCILASLVPHSLLEFRYFIIPFYIMRLNMRLPCTKLLTFELLFFVAINAVTVFMYVRKPFNWPDSTSPQRFMW